jgi:hypothetical protein
LQPERLLILILPVILSGCQTTTGFAEKNNALLFCQGARPIYWSVKDTPETIKQVKEHNAVWRYSCAVGSASSGSLPSKT